MQFFRINTRKVCTTSIILSVLVILAFITVRMNGKFFTSFSSRQMNLVQRRSISVAVSPVLPDIRNLTPDNNFTWSNLIDEPIDTVWNVTAAYLINGDVNRNCPVDDLQHTSLVRLKQALSYWIDVAKVEQIPWFLVYGSLLSYVFDKNITPFDAHIDIILPSWAYQKLEKYSTKLPIDWDEVDEDRPVLFLHPEFRLHPSADRRKYDCNGVITSDEQSACAFKENMGRLIVAGRHVNLFAGDHDPIRNIFFEIQTHHISVWKPKYYLPRRPCNFMGLKVFCPNKPLELTLKEYGPKLENLISHQQQCQLVDDFPKFVADWRRERGQNASSFDLQDLTYETLSDLEFCQKYPQNSKLSGICNFSPEYSALLFNESNGGSSSSGSSSSSSSSGSSSNDVVIRQWLSKSSEFLDYFQNMTSIEEKQLFDFD